MQRVMIIADGGGQVALPHLLADTEFEVVAAVGLDARTAASMRRLRPEIVLIDIEGMERLMALLGAISRTDASVRTVVIAGPVDQADLVRMIGHDVRAFLLRENVTTDIAVTLREVIAGGVVIDPAVAADLVAHVTRGIRLVGPFGLSRLEEQVLAQLTAELTNKQIGQRIGVSTSTVKSHVSNIFRKLDVRDRGEAAQFALEHRLG
jgi:DNA-binding NarL/FixJ family response regulator